MSKGHFKKSRFAKKIYIIFLISAENVLKKSEKLFIICFGIINYLFIEVNMKNRKLHKVFKRMPTLTTERLILRPMSTSDAWDMYEYAHREDVTEFLLWSPHPSVSYTRDYLAYIESRYTACEFYDWAITLADSGKMIGTAGFTKINTDHNVGEIGYVLSPEYHGKGLAAILREDIMSPDFCEAVGVRFWQCVKENHHIALCYPASAGEISF